MPAVNMHFHSPLCPVPGSCCGNGFYTFCPCPLLLASEWRHRWRRGSAGSWSVSRAWAAGTDLGPRLSNVTQGLAAAVRMPWGGGSRSQCRICRALANPPRGGGFGGWGRGGWVGRGFDLGRTGAASVHPCGESWLGEHACTRPQRDTGEVEGEVPVPRNTHRPAVQAHISPAPSQRRGQSLEPWTAL